MGVGLHLPLVTLDLYPSPSQEAIDRWSRGVHTVRSDIHPGDLGFRSRVVAVLDVWRDFRSSDGTLSSPGGACLINELQTNE